MISSTTHRVPLNTAEHLNAAIRRQIQENVAYYANAGHAAIDCRLRELDREWDIERALEANAATAVLVGVTLGAAVDKRWFAVPALVGGFLLQHAVQGWCPPVPLLRRLGFRTAYEIDQERYALKALRGDFRNLPPAASDDQDREAIERMEGEGGGVVSEPGKKEEDKHVDVHRVLEAVET